MLPPDCYYDELKGILANDNPDVRPEFIDHVVALRAAFDTAAAFGLSCFSLANLLASSLSLRMTRSMPFQRYSKV